MVTTTPVRGDTPTPPPPPPRRSLLERAAGFAQRHRWTALLLWVVVLFAVWGGATVTGDAYRDDFSLPGTETQQALETMKKHGSAQAGDTLDIVLHDERGVTGTDTRERVTAMLDEVAGLPRVAQVRSPYEDRQAVSRDGTVGYATVVLDVRSEDMTTEDTRRILDTARSAQSSASSDASASDGSGGLTVELGGEAARVLAESEGGGAEGVGMLAALVILGFMFGTVIAAGLPVVTAVFAVGSTLGAIILLSHVFTIASYTPYIMMLVGLGVGIDYALLIFARYRTELVRGASPEEANRRALDLAGRTVVFAGCTVIVALLGLVALGLGSLQGMAVAVALTVLVTMLASLTLLPALLALFGKRFARQFRARAEKRAAKGGAAESGAGWRRWSDLVQRRPLAALVLAVAALGALAAPALDLRLGLGDAGNEPPASTSRKAYDLLADGFGPGFNGPLVVVAETKTAGEDPGEAGAELTRTLDDTPGIAAATDPIPAEDGKAFTVIAFPETSPQDERTGELVHTLRDDVLADLREETGTRYLVGGATTAVIDYSDTVADRMPLFVAIVVGLSLLILVALFRSLLVPLKAALLNLLSIGAALGAMTLVFQKGLFGVEPGPIEAYLPVMIFAIVFGLSMDYEIFLISRIREEWLRGGDAGAAVREGLAHTGSVVTAAGAIMIAVFGAFMLGGDRMLQQFGFGMVVAVFVDAVVIRCLIVPAALQLMGRHAWWIPAGLDRRMPRLDIEKHD
ncbi:MMPL family transporter [Streptomyces hirsutus]|uniref:MMPL family transporter n=1 Tax=Streptomyces hirsutus TaxID=35620 RepID=A0ABZ1GLN4_9ACTN|nr:MMPL family transporter [Streptomyces hirsutus]WSD06201.1 MMPL family transporter [Streptomyces hirsutus]